MCERIKSGSRRGGDWHALCNVMPPDTGREELRLANRRWQGIPQGEWDPEKFGKAARRSGTSIGARPSGPPPQVTRTSPRMSGGDGRTERPGARTLDSHLEVDPGEGPAKQRGACSAKGGWTHHELAVAAVAEVVESYRSNATQ